MIKAIFVRVVTDIVIAFCVLQSWWLAAFAVAIIGAWFFPYFVEIIIAGLVFDALFGMLPDMGIWGYISTIEAICALIVIGGVRKIVRK